MIAIRLASDRYADRMVTLRTSANDWGDVSGARQDGGWSFVLPDVGAGDELHFKFVLDWRTWMDGEDLSIRPEPGGEYVFDDNEVRFGLRVAFQTSTFADRVVTLRVWHGEEHDDIAGVYEDGAWRFQLDEPSRPGLLRFAFVLDGHLLMDGSPFMVRPEPGGTHLYTESDVRFGVRVRLVTERYAERLVTLRTSADSDDLYGRYEAGVWTFVVDAARYAPDSPVAFVLDGDTPMEGADLTLPATAVERVNFDDAQVRFPTARGGVASAMVAVPPVANTPRITVTRPSAAVTAGYPLTLGGALSNVGAFSDGRIAYVTGIDITVAPTGLQLSGAVSGDGRAWNASVTFPAPGTYDLLIGANWVISYSDGRPNDTGTASPISDPPNIWPFSIRLEVGSPDPTIDSSAVQLRTGSRYYYVYVRVQAAVPVETVECYVAGLFAGTLSHYWADYWTGSFWLPVTNPVPAAGVSVDIILAARTKVGAAYARWSVQVIDQTPPSLTWLNPEDRARIEVLGQGADSAVARVVVDVTDTFGAGSGVVSAGVAGGGVTCTVDGAQVTTLTPVQGSDPVRWQGMVPITGLGSHTLVLRCRDGAGLETTQSRTVIVTPAAVRDVSQRGYLADLIDLVGSRLAVRSGGRRVAPADLTAVLSQPFRELAESSDSSDERPINAVRGRIEVLRLHLAAAPRAPAAHWPIDEGAGTVVRDETGGGSYGRLHGGTWGPGRAGGFAVVLDGTADFIDMGPAPQVAIDSAATVTAWIHPTAPGPAEGGVIAGRENNFLVARLPDGRIRWALATPAPGWGWVDTDAVAPEGQWTHVAVRYDGGADAPSVRTSINGTLVSEINAAGVITPVGPETDVRVGCRQSVADRFFAGSITDVRIYDVALSDYELRRLLGEDGSTDQVWFDDDLPPGAIDEGGEGWVWTTADPDPRSGTRAHRSTAAAGPHRHGFADVEPGWLVHPGDRLVAWVYLDPAQPPRRIVLEWQDSEDGAWSHGVSWGDVTAGPLPQVTSSPAHIGPLPAAGGWVRLEVPAALVSLERRVVTGLAFTLVDGQAWWDASGRVAAGTQVARCGYEAAAYAAILTALGTSVEEVRAARGAPPEDRRTLAGRLAISLSPARPDELDQLVLVAPTETELAALFLLEPTTPRARSSDESPPLLTVWRARQLRDEWGRQDHTPAAPVVDPDIVADTDIVAGPAGDSARRLRADRATWMERVIRELEETGGDQPDPAGRLDALLTAVLPAVDLAALAERQWQGHDITARLGADGLEPAGFDRLLTLRSLAAAGPLTRGEWDDAVAILANVRKRRQFDSWWAEERSLGLILDPDVFAVDASPVFLRPWRASWQDRHAWEVTLIARGEQLAGVDSSLEAAVADAERIALPRLRDALLAAAAPTGAASGRLSQELFLDLDVGPQLTTTRVGQAAEAVLGLLQSVNSAGDVTGVALPWLVVLPSTYPDRDAFFGELRWMQSYAAWSSAMDLYSHPENALLPKARDATSGAFATYVRSASPATAAEARTAAHQYWVNLPTQSPAPAILPAHSGLPPRVDGQGTDVFPNTAELTRMQLAALAAMQREIFAPYAPDTPLVGVPDGIREVFFDLPVQLAYDLAEAGQWRSALDWLRTVYDYTQPSGQRQVFAGFALETSTAASLTRHNWLNGGDLDPWALSGGRPHCYLRFTLMLIAGVLCDAADEEFTFDTAESRSRAGRLYEQAIEVLAAPELVPVDQEQLNPQLHALARRANANRAKLRVGLNISGMARPLGESTGEAMGSPPATDYRFPVLLARAQRLVASAAQTEASFLASLQQQDRERYDRLLAGQDVQLAEVRTRIARDQANLARREINLVRLQSARARQQSETYTRWVINGPNAFERDTLRNYQTARSTRLSAGDLQREAANWQGITSFAGGAFAGVGSLISGWGQYAGSVPGGLASVMAAAADVANIDASRSATLASWERRRQEWALAGALAGIDVQVAEEQMRLAQDRAAVAAEEARASEMTQRSAQARLAFLETKFTNAELYAYMSGVLGGVYRYLLQRAAAVARLAEQQLAFERQAPMPGYIKTSYWSPTGGGEDVRGLTGSARLQQDLTRLEEYAAETDRRKLQLTETISFATQYPVDLQRFRQSGVLPFATPLSLFERRLPGIYLATIRRVRVSVVALIPPTQGIRATLVNGGTSRVVVEEDGVYRARTLHTTPETVALTSPVNATGVFDLDLQPELLLPFEGAGVDTTWEFRLPAAANPFDFRTIADIIVGIDYTALYSRDRAADVIRGLPARRSSSMAVSLRRDFPDAWYDLVSSAELVPRRSSATPLLAVFPLTTADFPPDLRDLSVEAVTLLVIGGPNSPPDLTIDHLYRGGPPADPAVTTQARSVDGIVSTRGGSGASWKRPLTGRTRRPDVTWELGVVADNATLSALREGRLEDLVLSLDYAGTPPPWPV